MPIDPYASGYRPTPTIESFPTPPKGSLEFDLDQVTKKQSQKRYYSESMSSYHDLPSFKTPDSPIMAMPAAAATSQLSSSSVDEKKGFFRNVYDQIYTYFWGSSSSDVGGVSGEDTGGLGSPIGSTPKLAPTAVEWKKTQATMERITQLLEDANKIIDELHGNAKENVQMDEVVERFKTNWEHFFILLMKKQGALSANLQLGNSEEITMIHQAMKTIQEGIQEASLNKGNLDSKMWWYGTAGSVANATSLGLAGFMTAFQIAVFAGAATANPVAVAVGAVGGVVCAAIQGATGMASCYYNRQKIDEEGKIKIGQHRRQDAGEKIQDRMKGESSLRAADTTALEAMGNASRAQKELRQSLSQLGR